jgi:MarR family transcriptional regulator, lower aerobic nicotinate degradation pathway regulator
LVEKGLVSRARAEDDARRLELTLTPAARALLRKAPGAAQDNLIVAIERVPAATRAQLARGLARLVEEAGLNDEEPTMMFEEAVSSKPPARSRARTSGRARASARR